MNSTKCKPIDIPIWFVEKEIKYLDEKIDFYLYEDDKEADRLIWCRECLRKLLKKWRKYANRRLEDD